MNVRKLQFITILTLFLCSSVLSAQSFALPAAGPRFPVLSDSASIYLLTCTPGTETYSKYGHSAIRVYDPIRHIDEAFNYGVFSFGSKDFYYKFLKGQTYYRLEVEQTDYFISSSKAIGRITYQQRLNLTPQQRQALYAALCTNAQPHLCRYLYNFVFDNCATRPYALISRFWTHSDNEGCAEGAVAPEFESRRDSYRQMVAYYSEQNSWAGFGIDFIFGKDADRIMTTEQRLFLPEQLMNYVSEVEMCDVPLCAQEDVRPFEVARHPWITSPYAVVLLLCVFLSLLTLLDWCRKKVSWWADAGLLILLALLGVIAFYLSFFSVHPLVGHNYNLLLINPLLLLIPLLLPFAKCRRWIEHNLSYLGLLLLVLLLARLLSGQTWHHMLWLMVVIALRWIVLGDNKVNTFIRSYLIRRLTVALALMLFPIAAHSAPRLTVFVTVDGLSAEAMNELRTYWQAGGLRTLEEEAHKATLHFDQQVWGGAETLATLLTGVQPQTHGIAADTYFSRQDRKAYSVFADSQQVGIGTDQQLSPAALLSTTIADEFRMRNPDRSRIYACGISPEQTLLLAGHSANGCAWIDEQQMRWVSTGYYSAGLPSAADDMNVNGRFAELAQKQWNPRMQTSAYMHPTADEKKSGFAYLGSSVLSCSPNANELVVELALALQKQEQLGTRSQPDMLLLQLTAQSPLATSDMIHTAEQEDMYLYLNQHIGYLIEQLNRRIGKDKYMLILTATPHFGKGNDAFEKINMPIRYFRTERAAALINTYLMAIYGHERWIDGGYGHSIYLNRTLIEQKKMRVYDLQQQVSDFLLEFEGVQMAMPSSDVMKLPNDGEWGQLKHSYNKQQSGDILFTLQPSWVLGESDSKRCDNVAETDVSVPLYIWSMDRSVSIAQPNMSATELKQLILSY